MTMGIFQTLHNLLNQPSEDIADYYEPTPAEDLILEGDYVEDVNGALGIVDVIEVSPYGGNDLYAYVIGSGWADWLALDSLVKVG